MRGARPVRRRPTHPEALQALTRAHVPLEALAPGYSPAGATLHERARAVARAVTELGARLRRAA